MWEDHRMSQGWQEARMQKDRGDDDHHNGLGDQKQQKTMADLHQGGSQQSGLPPSPSAASAISSPKAASRGRLSLADRSPLARGHTTAGRTESSTVRGDGRTATGSSSAAAAAAAPDVGAASAAGIARGLAPEDRERAERIMKRLQEQQAAVAQSRSAQHIIRSDSEQRRGGRGNDVFHTPRGDDEDEEPSQFARVRFRDRTSYFCDRSAIHRMTIFLAFALATVALLHMKDSFGYDIRWDHLVLLWAVNRVVEYIEITAMTARTFWLYTSHGRDPPGPPHAHSQLALGRLLILFLELTTAAMLVVEIQTQKFGSYVMCGYGWLNGRLVNAALHINVMSQCKFYIPDTHHLITAIVVWIGVAAAMKLDGWRISWVVVLVWQNFAVGAFLGEELLHILQAKLSRFSGAPDSTPEQAKQLFFSRLCVVLEELPWLVLIVAALWWHIMLLMWLQFQTNFYRLAYMAYPVLGFFFLAFAYQCLVYRMLGPRAPDWTAFGVNPRRFLPSLYIRPRYVKKHNACYLRYSGPIPRPMAAVGDIESQTLPLPAGREEEGAVSKSESQISESENGEDACIVCRAARANGIIMECGHSACCYTCARQIFITDQKCHYCRQPSTFFHKIDLNPVAPGIYRVIK
ncbi:unnamed protein product [Vitrella brassicaformis CCMP3155]|uniref:RING-type domain-containing protein n=1 Tax=Vitrella brassicaformis (strain CCMP3155) TaxID=1169540 RepID=A0A0G4EQ37_VITBC|nr:unnamed protein product [Vitrella brassicaformis CCMP3155]|eukprot:CEL99539.1 unnamed protein product [Vitrella brassicaformis CCMP3155]